MKTPKRPYCSRPSIKALPRPTKKSLALKSHNGLEFMPSMSKVLYFGKKTHPKMIVVMLHGFNDTADCNQKEAAYWAKGLEDFGALVVVPQAPHKSHDSTSKCPCYNWIPH